MRGGHAGSPSGGRMKARGNPLASNDPSQSLRVAAMRDVGLDAGIGLLVGKPLGADAEPFAGFGIVGYLFERFRFPITPLVLGVILGPLAETSFMTTMVSFNNDWTVFFTRPLSLVMLLMAAGLVLLIVLPYVLTVWAA